ncbi:hypothetical protein U9M48_006579 [Paspalum notatum var. saurae]|uniref:Uncharacterized protein n=1 Tax=Paspalum notatum var. saurae TaxID=547442 RepID=A0AAQ3PZZ8_PASNO
MTGSRSPAAPPRVPRGQRRPQSHPPTPLPRPASSSSSGARAAAPPPPAAPTRPPRTTT